MSDYHLAGGVPAVLKTIRDYLKTDLPLSVSGKTLADTLLTASHPDGTVIRDVKDPLAPNGCFGILKGNLAPQGAVVKKTGIEAGMLIHKGPAVVFDSEEEVPVVKFWYQE